jgi:transcriptional regulator with XRE-family HTH domain
MLYPDVRFPNQGGPMEDTKMRPSEVFTTRLRETRKARGLSQTELAHQMTERGRPLSNAALLRIEGGERSLSLDEALALAAVLYVAPAHLLSPPAHEEYVWLTDNYGVDGEGMRAWLLHGDKFIATASDYHRGEHAKAFEQVMLVHARALADAQRGDDKAGMRGQLVALGQAALDYQNALEARGFNVRAEQEPPEEER